MSTTVKPLVHWALFHKYSLRYTSRQPELVGGVFGTPAGNVPFRFAPVTRTLIVGDNQPVTLNEYGWEVNANGEIIIKGYKKPAPNPEPRIPDVDGQENNTTDADTRAAGTEIEAADGAGVSE